MIKKSQREWKILPTWEFTARGEEGEGHGAVQAPFTMLLPSLSISRLEIPSIFFSLPLPFFFYFLPVSSEAECETEAYAGLCGSKQR